MFPRLNAATVATAELGKGGGKLEAGGGEEGDEVLLVVYSSHHLIVCGVVNFIWVGSSYLQVGSGVPNSCRVNLAGCSVLCGEDF